MEREKEEWEGEGNIKVGKDFKLVSQVLTENKEV